MTYKDSVDYINSFINFEKIPRYQYASSFKLERMEAILKGLGNPHKDLNIIHVAGSKGKGSVCAMTAYILKEAGYSVGLYTSPHLVDFKERIRILNKGTRGKGNPSTPLGTRGARGFEGAIKEKEFIELIGEVETVAEKFRNHEDLGRASFFEILTACAFLYFKKKQVDVAVLETGLGGRLDATNVTMPLVCGITNISLEHTDKLGNTLAEIAREKAGIVKKGQGAPHHSLRSGQEGQGKEQGMVVSAIQEKEAINAIRKVCVEKKAILYEVGKDIKYFVVKSDEKGHVFNLEGPGYSYKNLEINLIGGYQVENASLSIGMLKAMGGEKISIREHDIREGLKKAAWPGRLQIVQRDPCVILDGAHNPASMLALISSVKKIFEYERLIIIFGISNDKDIEGVSGILEVYSDIIILTKAKDNPRAAETSELKGYFKNLHIRLEESIDIDDALQKALKISNKDDLIIVTGSLFVVGDALALGKDTLRSNIVKVSN